jgi:hypothetical protein
MNIADVPAALLAGGLATRRQQSTATVLKALVAVAGRPFIDHELVLLHRNGIRKVAFRLGYLGEMVEHHLGDGSAFRLEVHYSHDGPRLLGVGAREGLAPRTPRHLQSTRAPGRGPASSCRPRSFRLRGSRPA